MEHFDRLVDEHVVTVARLNSRCSHSNETDSRVESVETEEEPVLVSPGQIPNDSGYQMPPESLLLRLADNRKHSPIE